MESPVVIENCANFATPIENDETGFPFDDSDYDSHDHIEARLNDLAQRHPEFATHLRFGDLPSSLRRKRYGSGSSTEQDDVRQQTPRPGAGASTSRFADYGFPSGFNRFPFTTNFEDDFAEPRREDKPPEVPKHQDKRGRKPNPNLPQHLSNTVDLGQKQPPVEESRSQRSMSAPPENRSTSRVENESSNFHEEQPVMGKTFSRQNQPQASREHTPTQPKEHIIPIHVEGRDEPVMPRNIHTSGSAEKVFGNEKVYGATYQHPRQSEQQQPPPGFQYTPNKSKYEQFAQGPFKQQYAPHPQQARQQTPPMQQQAPPTKQHQAPPPQPQQQQQNQRQTPPPQPMINDPLEKIKCVRFDVMKLMEDVQKFQGTKNDKEYLYLDEMLTRNLLKLDDIETDGKDNIRTARKEAIKCIQSCINSLDTIAQANDKESKLLEAAKQSEATETTNPSGDVIQAEQQHAADTSEPIKFKSHASLVIGGASDQSAGSEQPQQTDAPQDKMEVDPQPAPTAEQSSTEASTPATVCSDTTAVLVDETKNSGQPTPSESAETQPANSDTSQTAVQDTTQK